MVMKRVWASSFLYSGVFGSWSEESGEEAGIVGSVHNDWNDIFCQYAKLLDV